MLTGERRIKLLEAIENKQFISVAQLSEIFQVHETTIRRDLDELESQGLVVRIHGGVVPASIKQDEPDFEDRATENMLEKTKIGKYATNYIKSGEAIILDSGTTTLQIAKPSMKCRSCKTLRLSPMMSISLLFYGPIEESPPSSLEGHFSTTAICSTDKLLMNPCSN